MSRIVFIADAKMLTVQLSLPEYVLACASRSKVLHLHRPGALATVCGRAEPTHAVRKLKATNGAEYTLCPYCLTWAQRAERPEGSPKGAP